MIHNNFVTCFSVTVNRKILIIYKSIRSSLRMLAEIVFEKINFGKQFQIHNIFHIKDHQKTT